MGPPVRGLKFVDGKHAVRPRRRRRSGDHLTQAGGSPASASVGPALESEPVPTAYVYPDPDPDPTWSSHSTGPSSEAETLILPDDELTLPSSSMGASSFVSSSQAGSFDSYQLTKAPREPRARFVSDVLGSLDKLTQQNEIQVFAPWFGRVHERLGNSVALDTAMAAFALHLLGKGNGDQSLVQESRSLYGQSLGALQRALNHPVHWRGSETLCATRLLCHFELFAGTTDADSWKKHAAGVSWLIQRRGAEAHRDPFDRAVLLSFRPMIIMDCLFDGRDCFLAQRNWQRMLSELGASQEPSGSVHREVAVLFDVYHAHLARLPSILRHGYVLREARRHGLSTDTGDLEFHRRRAERLRQDFADWYAQFRALLPEPAEVPSQDPASPYETVLAFPNVWFASLVMSYWASMLIVQEVLNRTGHLVDYKESNMDLTRNILRSLETVGDGYMGPYRVGYALRIAYEFADLRSQVYIRTLLVRFESHYAATSTTTYPAPGMNEYGFS